MEITILRHGRTRGENINAVIDGKTDSPLSMKGIIECNILRSELEMPEIVFCSRLKRAYRTAKILYPTKEPIVMDSLNEIDFGDLSGKTLSKAKFLRFHLFRNSNFHNGETANEFLRRCVVSFGKIIFAALSENTRKIAVIAHNGWMLAVLQDYLGLISKFKMKFDYLESIRIAYKDNKWTHVSKFIN